jgi:hypothetical protein
MTKPIKEEMIFRILETFEKAGINCVKSCRTNKKATYYNLILPVKFCGKEKISKLRVSSDEILISSRNYNVSLWIYPELGYARYTTKSSRIIQMALLLVKGNILSPVMTVFEYALWKFIQGNLDEWKLTEQADKIPYYTSDKTGIILTGRPYSINIFMPRTESSPSHELRIEYNWGLSNSFIFKTLSGSFEDILALLSIYKEISSVLEKLDPISSDNIKYHNIVT